MNTSLIAIARRDEIHDPPLQASIDLSKHIGRRNATHETSLDFVSTQRDLIVPNARSVGVNAFDARKKQY